MRQWCIEPYTRSVRQFIARNKYVFLAGTIAGLLLRLAFLFVWPHVEGDSLLYIDIARNWLLYGVFGLTHAAGGVNPTYLRLPGYPAFLAFSFALFGADKLRTALCLQVLVDLAACFVVAALAYETFSQKIWRDRATLATFWIAALCPFTANYAALPLTESLEVFFTALAFHCAVKGVKALPAAQNRRRWWIGSGAAISGCILLRPDGGILLIAAGIYLLALLWRNKIQRQQIVAAGLLVAFFALAPLLPWTLRNWRTFHEFHPLAPRYMQESSEYVPRGFDRWQKTWVVDYVSVEDIGWKVSADAPGEAVDLAKLPARAFDSEAERPKTAEIFDEYNRTLLLSPETDAKFAALADERIAHSRLRFYALLPIARLADMWLRPRTEMLPLEQRWWQFQDGKESTISISFAVLNFLLLLAALVAAIRFRDVPGYGLMIGFVILRSLFLLTIENPEPRYTLECYPVVFVFAGAAVAWMCAQRP